MRKAVLVAMIALGAATTAAAQIKPYAPIRTAKASPPVALANFDLSQPSDVLDFEGAPAITFRTRKFDVDVSPYAGLNTGPRGGLATAGARIEMSRSKGDDEANGLGDQGRWYLFAATSGKALGLNLLQDDHGWDRGGWSSEANSTLFGDAELGFGWRKGDMKTSLGYRHREGRRKHTMFGQKGQDDSLLALSFSFTPGR